MLCIAICDDNLDDTEKIAKLVKDWADAKGEDIRIHPFSSPYELLDRVSAGEAFDFFLLDILMPEMTGISLGEHLQNLFVEPLLIFLTSSEDYYSDAFRLYAFQYIRKPIYPNSLFPVLDKALFRCEKRKKDIFILKTAEGIVQIPMHSIVYVELLSHICHFHLSDGGDLRSQYLRTSFDSFLNPLLLQDRFVKTHASFVINLNFASKLAANALTMTTGASVPVARSFSSQVQRKYIAFVFQEGEDMP